MITGYKIIKGFLNTSVEFLKFEVREFVSPMHYHKRNCIGRIDSGSIIIEFENKTCKFKKGDFFIITSFSNHCCRVEKNKNVGYSVISFSDINELKFLRSNSKILKNIKKEGFLPLFNFAYKNSIYNGFTQDEIIKTIISFINNNYMKSLSIDSISAFVKLSPSRIQHIFKEAMGMPLKKYIIQEKIRKSKEMVLSKNLLDITFDCGFYDQSHFSRNFKKYTGLTPLKYANSILMANNDIAHK